LDLAHRATHLRETIVTTDSETNAAQSEYWNSDEAFHWVEDQESYDRMLAPFATALLERAAFAPDDRVLDIGCGTGPTTCAAARLVPQGQARGLDISQQMIEGARSRARELGITNVSFDVGDAQIGAFAPDADVVISRFGVMFFDDPAGAFANLRTAIRAGGRLVFVCWQELFANEWMAVTAGAALAHLPLPDPGPPGAPGPFSLGDADHVREVLRTAGYSEITIDPFESPILVAGGGSVEEASTFMQRTGMARALFADAPPDAVERAKEAVTAVLSEHWTPEGVRMGTATWLVTATR
jgi:SAM-dependent methyltransferase